MTLPTIRLVFGSVALSLPLLLWLWLRPARREAAAALLVAKANRERW